VRAGDESGKIASGNANDGTLAGIFACFDQCRGELQLPVRWTGKKEETTPQP
jgi:hypothetical protein